MCENYKHKKIFCFGLFLLVLGFFWYLNETGFLIIEPFWPIAFIVIGFLLMIKGLLCKCQSEKPAKLEKKK